MQEITLTCVRFGTKHHTLYRKSIAYIDLCKLEEYLASKQRAESMQNHNCYQKVKGQKSDHAFLPEGIQIEDLTQASCHSESARSAR